MRDRNSKSDPCGSLGLLTWVGILITYIRWDKGVRAQNIDRNIFPYKSTLVRPFELLESALFPG